MKKIISIILSLCLVIALCGCVSVNVTKTEEHTTTPASVDAELSEQDYLNAIENAKKDFGVNSSEFEAAVEDYLSYIWDTAPERFEEEEAKFYSMTEASSSDIENEIVSQTEQEYEDLLQKLEAEKGLDSDEYSEAFGEYMDFLINNDRAKYDELEAKWSEQENEQYMQQQETQEAEIAAFEVPLTYDNLSAYFTCRSFPVYDLNGRLVNVRYKLIPTEEYWNKICCEKEFSFQIVYDIVGIPSYVKFDNGTFYVTNYNGKTVRHTQQMNTFDNSDVRAMIQSAYTGELPESNAVGTLAKANVTVSAKNGRYCGFDYFATITQVSGSIYLYED